VTKVRDIVDEAMTRREEQRQETYFDNFEDLPSIDFEQAEAALRFEERLKLLNEIGLALSAVRDIDMLLDLILSKARELTGADAGSLYLIDNSNTASTNDDTLYFRKAQNDSIYVDTSRSFPVGPSSLAGYVALTGKTMVFEDVYRLPPDAPYQFNQSFDKANCYRTKSVLVVPMHNHKGGMLGVLQLINRKRHREVKLTDEAIVEQEVLPFDDELTDLAASLASQASVAVQNSQFVSSIRSLFRSFVDASASAIEDRDPCTSGHSRRVTALTLAMAKAAHASQDGPFKDVQFSPIEIDALEYAGKLHDFGKIGVPEHVLTKSHKLKPEDYEKIKGRLFALRQERRAYYAHEMSRAWRCQSLETEKTDGARDAATVCAGLEQQLQAELKEFEALFQMLARANNPAVTFLPDEEFGQQQLQVHRLAQMTYEDETGKRCPIIEEKEIRALGIRKGSLTQEEFHQIQSHAQLSYEFLKKIHWTEEYARIPLIAWGHHEKLNGKGYPRGVTAEEIPLETRMMTVADIFEALTAERPYKRPMPLDRALSILSEEAEKGDLDKDVVQLFIKEKIYEVLHEDIGTHNAHCNVPDR
jgi:HD-GYP domain-containing protein (c-di-GMP phosphodiesterase class II)